MFEILLCHLIGENVLTPFLLLREKSWKWLLPKVILYSLPFLFIGIKFFLILLIVRILNEIFNLNKLITFTIENLYFRICGSSIEYKDIGFCGEIPGMNPWESGVRFTTISFLLSPGITIILCDKIHDVSKEFFVSFF